MPLGFFVLFMVNIYMAFGVGAARKKYGISYPQLYAVPGTPRNYAPGETKALSDASNTQPLSELCSAEDAYAYNCVQRGHANSLENYPLIIGLTLVSWGFPIPSGFALISWALGRIFYFEGYKVKAENRNQLPAALLTYPALFTLWGLALTTAVHLFQKTPPYNYS